MLKKIMLGLPDLHDKSITFISSRKCTKNGQTISSSSERSVSRKASYLENKRNNSNVSVSKVSFMSCSFADFDDEVAFFVEEFEI